MVLDTIGENRKRQIQKGEHPEHQCFVNGQIIAFVDTEAGKKSTVV